MIFKLIKNVLISLLVLIPIVFGLVAFFVDKNEIISAVNSKIEKQFGKQIKYDQDLDFSFFPVPQIKLTNVNYFDELHKLELEIAKLELVSSWHSIFSLEPKIIKLNLIEPKLKLNYKQVARKKFILIKNSQIISPNFQNIINKFEKIRVEQGTISFLIGDNFHEISKFNSSLKIGKNYEILSTFYYENFKSSYNVNIFGEFENGFNFQIDQKFLNKNSLIYNGEINFGEYVIVDGKINSDKLNIEEVLTLISMFNFINKPNYYAAGIFFNNPQAIFDVYIEDLNYNNYNLSKNNFKLIYSNNILKIKDLNSFYDKTELNLDGFYNFSQKKFDAKASFNSLKIDERFFSDNSKIFIKEAYLKCSANILYNQSSGILFLEKLSIKKGKCRTKKPKISGINIDKMVTKVDNLNTFQDFFDLFNVNKYSGLTVLDFMSLDFRFKNKKFLADSFEAKHPFVKVKSIGEMNVVNKNIDFNNEVKIKTDKFKNLPSFKIFFKGDIDDYNVTYDLEKVKSALFKKGVDKLIGKKKIIISPDSLKNILNNEEVKEFNPDKLFDLFLD